MEMPAPAGACNEAIPSRSARSRHLADFITQRKKGLLSLVTFTPPSTSLTIIEPLLKDAN